MVCVCVFLLIGATLQVSAFKPMSYVERRPLISQSARPWLTNFQNTLSRPRGLVLEGVVPCPCCVPVVFPPC